MLSPRAPLVAIGAQKLAFQLWIFHCQTRRLRQLLLKVVFYSLLHFSCWIFPRKTWLTILR